ncbi:MAG: DUF2064 domain-containing protein [Rhodothalassiaceae bacterium]
MSGAIAILAKTPGLTPAKTRLAATLGTEAAEAFYRLALDAVEAAVTGFLAHHPAWRAVWALAEGEGIDHRRWQRLGAVPSGEGGLGRRMAHVYERFRAAHGGAILIGTDAPQMTSRHLAAAVAALATADFVIGPASDGGFWLIGGRRPVPPELWERPRYSGPHAREDLLTAFAGAGLPQPVPLMTLTDVDEIADLAPMISEMPRDPAPPQAACIAWARSHVIA